MVKKTRVSETSIDSNAHPKGDKIQMKWRAVHLWFIVLTSLFALSSGVKWNTPSIAPSIPRKNEANAQVMPIISYSGNTRPQHLSDERCFSSLRGGAAIVNPFPSGYNPFGYGLTDLGKEFMKFNGCAESDVGRFLSTLKSGRKKEATIKDQWLEIVRVSKQGQNMRIYRTLDELIQFCLAAGFID